MEEWMCWGKGRGEEEGRRKGEGGVEAMRSPPPRPPARGIHRPKPIHLSSREAKDSSEEQERKEEDEEWPARVKEEEERKEQRKVLPVRIEERGWHVVETHPPSLDRSPSLREAREGRGEGEERDGLTCKKIGRVWEKEWGERDVVEGRKGGESGAAEVLAESPSVIQNSPTTVTSTTTPLLNSYTSS